MIYILPTKRGMGVEIWGTFDDLNAFYDVISKFWGDENKQTIKGYGNRDKILSGFSYEIRKAYEGSRLIRETSHFSLENIQHFGVQISWVHFLFFLSALRYNMRFYDANKFEVSLILQIEYWLEQSMSNYDETGAKDLKGYIDDGIYAANEYGYQYMRSINLEYFLLNGGKKAFRKLPQLLMKSVYLTDDYKSYLNSLMEDAKKLNCGISDLEVDDDHIDYENLKW